MQIRDTFATAISEKIEPIVKVADRSAPTIRDELTHLVMTPQWEKHIHSVLDAYANAATSEHEGAVGVWINGFFGSGKSLLMKVIGLLLEGGDVEGQSVHELFLSRFPVGSQYASEIKHNLSVLHLKVATTAIGGNLHSLLADKEDSLPLLAFKLFANRAGFTQNWPFAYAIEYRIEEVGKTADFHARVEELAGAAWDEIANDPEVYFDVLFRAAAELLPKLFSSPAAVETSMQGMQKSGLTAQRIVERLRRWCVARNANGRRHKLLLEFDELGQWISAGDANHRTMQVQALVEEAAANGGGHIWIAVTAHGELQALEQNVNQEQYAKILQRFAHQCRLTNEDITQVVEQRVLQKTQPGRKDLAGLYGQKGGSIADMGQIGGAKRTYPPVTDQNFATYYPYLPWTVAAIPDVVKGIAQAARRDEALTGSNRTMIAVVQGGIIETPQLLSKPVGELVSLADLYSQLSTDVPIETKTDINRVKETIPSATDFTQKVACGLYLLGRAEYIPTTLDNVARAVINKLDTILASVRVQVKTELERLVAAGYAKVVGDEYVFLNTQQRTFQDKVRSRQEDLALQSASLSTKLQEYKNENALQFYNAPLSGRDIPLKVILDTTTLHNPTGAQVVVEVYSPLQRAIDSKVSNDEAMRQFSALNKNTIFLRMDDVHGFRTALAQAVATEEVANDPSTAPGSADAEVASQARQKDLPGLKATVRSLLGQAIRSGAIFFRGTQYQMDSGATTLESVRGTLSTILPQIYPRLHEAPNRIADEQKAVKAALSNNVTNADLQALAVYKADGTLNESHPLITALRGQLPGAEEHQEATNAGELRKTFEAPPYGWDGNLVKVGLALLLRASACRLIDNGAFVTDPNSALAAELLTTDSRFRNMRVQAVKQDISTTELVAIRNSMAKVLEAPANTSVVVATLNNALGEALTKLASQLGEIITWAQTAQCPLPPELTSGQAIVQELLNIGATNQRLLSFRDQAETLQALRTQADGLEHFKSNESDSFQRVRNFFMTTVNANLNLPAVKQFLMDYRTLERDGTLTQAQRWNELNQAHAAAQAAVTTWISDRRSQAAARLKALPGELEQTVAGYGVPAEQVADEAAPVAALYDPVRKLLDKPTLSLNDANQLLAASSDAEIKREEALHEIKARYTAEPPDSTYVMKWSDLPQRTIHDEDDLRVWLDDLRATLTPHLANDKIITIG